MKPSFALLIAVLLAASFGVLPAHAACSGTTYTVNAGETLYSIAQTCGINYVVLIDINYEISDPNLIRPGQTIRLTAEEPIPEYTKPVSGPAQPYGLQPGGVYIVRKGDSLARIAYLYDTTLYELYQANPQLGGRPVVYAGQVIKLPFVARQKKGWVGVSTLAPAAYSSIQARAVDFPSYAIVTFRLHQIFEDEENPGIKDVGPDSTVTDDYYSVYGEATTDARGSARLTMKLPYGAYDGENWVVDVFTDGLGEDNALARSPVMVIGGVDEED